MDKSWIWKDRLSKEYSDGVDKFLQFATTHCNNSNLMKCPCKSCQCFAFHTQEEIRAHLFRKGFDTKYDTWIWHGEPTSVNPPKTVNSSFAECSEDNHPYATFDMVNDAFKYNEDDLKSFDKLLEDAEKPLYPGCTSHTKLSALMKLYNIKGKYGWSDKSFSELLDLLSDMLPPNNEMPTSMYEAKKTMVSLGLSYEKIHACPNDCILYRKEYASESSCPTCGLSRWKETRKTSKPKKGIPAKVVWYFPPIPRFRRLFQSSEIAQKLTWHAKGRVNDGKLRHPADTPAWKLVDRMWPDFSAEHRNLRLAISADGFNPHSSLSSSYSCWPVVMVTYNLPPWLCMQKRFMMLSLLISGPRQPGNDIDVYLAPLIDDLKMLWEEGVQVYDAYKQEMFNLRAVLLWTINDFPAYGNLSGYSVKGYYACPICEEGTSSCRLKHGKKNVYMGHRRFLPKNHPFRKLKKAFNGHQEFDLAPRPLTGEQILQKQDRVEHTWGKNKDKKRKKVELNENVCWKKKSLFFTLPYWKHLYVRHNLDVMHIEKNVCESIYGTLLNIPGKTKDSLNTRMDLVHMGLRKELQPKVVNNRAYLPPACYSLSKKEKQIFCQTLYDLRVPFGYCSNFKNLVSLDDLKLVGLKSHDCHALMQQLLPLAIRSILPKHVRCAITRFCMFFNDICSKVVDVPKLNQIESDLVVTLCLLEKYFPPSFFDIMVHLTVHLVREVRLCGPVYLRWMYPFERFMKILKGFVRNRNRPEGCIAECYIATEAIEFSGKYLNEVNVDEVDSPLVGGRVISITAEEWEQAHLYVLENTEEVQPYIDEHMQVLKNRFPRQAKNAKWLQTQHNRCFIQWFKDKVSNSINNDEPVSSTLKWLAPGPRSYVTRYSGYIINNCHFHTRDHGDDKVHQNSGVSVKATTMQVASSKDKNPITGDLLFYGVIREIWVLDYHILTVPIFKCDWVDSNGGVRVDDMGVTLVDLTRIGHKSDPFILAAQAKQVFYVTDPSDGRWSVVQFTNDKSYKIDRIHDQIPSLVDHHPFVNVLPNIESFDTVDDDDINYVRDNCEGVWVDN